MANRRALGLDISGDNNHIGIAACRIQDFVCCTTAFPLLHQGAYAIVCAIHVTGQPFPILVVVDREQYRLSSVGQFNEIRQAGHVPVPDQRCGNGRQHFRQPLSFRHDRRPNVVGHPLLLRCLLARQFAGQFLGGPLLHDLQAITNVFSSIAKRLTDFTAAGLKSGTGGIDQAVHLIGNQPLAHGHLHHASNNQDQENRSQQAAGYQCLQKTRGHTDSVNTFESHIPAAGRGLPGHAYA